MSRRRPPRSPLALAALAILSALPVAPVAAQETPRFSTEVALDVASPQVAAVTDDGTHAVVVVRTRRGRVDVDHGRYGDPTYVAPSLAPVMVVDTRSGARSWLHEEPVQASGFAWSPDGSRLAYLLREGDTFSLRIHTAGERTRTLSLRTDRAIASSAQPLWTPDGNALLLALRPQGWEARARQAFHALTDAPVIVQDSREDFLSWDAVRNLAEEQVTVLVDVSSGAVRDLLSEVVPRDPGFTADGRHLTYGTAVRTKTSYTREDGTDYGLHVMELASGDVQDLVAPREERISGEWSPHRDAFAWADEGAVFVRRLGEEEPVEVTRGLRTLPGDTAEVRFGVEEWSPDGSRLLLTSPKGWHVLALKPVALSTVLPLEEDADTRPRRSVQRWGADGHIYFTWSARDRWERGLKRVAVGSGTVEDMVLDDGVYGQWTVAEDGSRWIYARSDGDRPDDLWVGTAGGGAPTRLTELNPELANIPLARTELVEYLDVDGNTLYGILYYPIGYQEGREYPLVVEVYEEFFDNGFNENMNLVTARGWFGFRPSVRFEEGYPAEAWLKAVPNAVNTLIARGVVDPEQVGVYGQSYGGYAVNLLITQTDRFAAAANISGKVNIISFLGDSEKITTRNYTAAEVGQDRIGATLWEQPHKYIEHSAVMFADRIETPLLMLSGEGDWNVPATNQREMYYALRRLGKEVVWVHYTAGGHGAGRASTVADFHDHWQRLLDFFAEHFEKEATAEEEGGG